jgi:peptidyl-prolyl cis-trans isomerase A (cyclophilin A)
MQQRSLVLASVRTASAATLTIVTLAALSACGGGGDSGGTPTASVTSMSVSATRYAGTATVSINGTGLDSTLALSSSVCSDFTLQSGSTTSSAIYNCTVSGGLTGAVVAKSNGTQVGSANLTVPAPIVKMSLNNTQSVNGDLIITLAPDKAPKTVDNFLHYVNTGFYNNTIFHRVVANFIMQGGGYAPQITDLSTATLKTGTFAPIALENTGLSNVIWSIAMANANTSTNTSTTTSQFFINLANNSTNLDGNYAVFGSITAGTNIAQAVVAAPANCVSNQAALTVDCLPVPNVVITAASQTQ